MVMKGRLTKFLALLVIFALIGTVQAQGSTGNEAKNGYIVVGLYPVADFSANPVSGKAPLVVAFTDQSTGSTPRTYQWNFGDGGTSTITNPTHTYTAAGLYTVTLTITNSYGTDTATKVNYILVGIGPVADFGATPLSGNLPLAVTFQDMSTRNPTSWSWNFGDGGISVEQNPHHTYTRAGTYTVSLTVTNAFGRDTKTKSGYISTGTPPTADFTAVPTTGGVPLSVKFTDASKGGPTSWSWNFGDGSTSTDRNPTHVFTSAGTYTVALTATNPYGSDTATKVNFVTAGVKPVAEFAANPRFGIAPLTVTFTDLSTGNPATWAWNFGDGSTSTEQNPVHVYKLEGSYDVSLTVTNTYGADTMTKTETTGGTCVSGASGYIVVGRTPAADFSGNPVSGKQPLVVVFTDRSTGAAPLTYQWNFGDSGTSADSNPTHTYTATGVYTVTLTITNSFGTDTETKVDYIRVGIGPVADFGATPVSGNLPLAVTFQDLSTGNPTTWSWNFGDGGASSEQNPHHTFTRAGIYTVSLTVINAFGRDTKTKSGYINTGIPPTADFTSTARTGLSPLSVKFTDASKGGPTSWSWNFGDGSTSTDRNPTHVYTSAGTFTVALTATNPYGSDTATKVGYVIAGGKPVADFTADQRVGVKPFTVTFTDLSTGNPATWAWDFGDQTTSTEQNPVHVYTHEGAYDVTLTVTNTYGTDTVKKTAASASGPTVVAPGATSTAGVTSTTAQGTAAAPQQTQMPGFEGILAITGLAAMVYLAKRH